MRVSLPKLRDAVHRYEEGCRYFTKAMRALQRADPRDYERSLQSAAMQGIGSLELAMKVYLRGVRRDVLPAESVSQLHKPTFYQLVELTRKYADPPLDPSRARLFLQYRDLLRNSAEHDATVPASDLLADALRATREFLVSYLEVGSDTLPEVTDEPAHDIARQRSEYYAALRQWYEYFDFGGISPRVGSKVVRMPLRDLFVPLTVRNETLGLGNDSLSVWGSSLPRTAADPPSSIANVAASLPFSQALGHVRLVILGEPGAGKTTLGKYLALAVATNDWSNVPDSLGDFVPIVVKATELATHLRDAPALSFLEYLLTRHTTRFEELFKWAVTGARAILIVDGLDEIPDAHLRSAVVRRIEQFAGEYQRNHFIVTSRPVGYRQNQLTAGFHHVVITELSTQTAKQFLSKWHAAIDEHSSPGEALSAPEQRAAELWAAIERNPGTRKLAGNPLLLTIIALTHFRGTKLPERRVELYHIATDTLLENWPLRGRRVDVNAADLLLILEPIAHHMLAYSDGNLIGESDLIPLMEAQVVASQGVSAAEARVRVREALALIEEHTGLFLERGIDEHGEKQYGFLHLTFAEYLAGRQLAALSLSGSLDLSFYLHEERWREALLLMAGHVGTFSPALAAKLLRDVLTAASEYEEILHRDLFFAGAILADNVRVSHEVRAEVVRRLLQLALSTPHGELFDQCMLLLRTISGWATDTIRHDLTVRTHNEPSALAFRNALLREVIGLRDEKDILIAQKVIWSGAPEGWLIREAAGWIARADGEPTFRYSIMSPWSAPVAVTDDQAESLLELDPECADIEAYLELFDQTGEKSTVLIDHQHLSAWSYVRLVQCTTSLELLELLWADEEWDPNGLRMGLACTALLEAIRSPDSSVAHLSARSLRKVAEAHGHFGGLEPEELAVLRTAVEDATNVAKTRGDPALTQLCLVATLAISSEEQALPLLIGMVDTGPPEMVAAALQGVLGRLDTAINADPERPIKGILLTCLEFEDPHVRARAALALVIARLQSGVSTLRLVQALAYPHWPQTLDECFVGIRLLLRLSTGSALAIVTAAAEAICALIVAAASASLPSESEYRLYVAHDSAPPADVIRAVEGLLAHPDARVRTIAVEVWDAVRERRVPSEQLVSLVQDENPAVVAKALCAIEPADLVQPALRGWVERLLRDSNSAVAGAAAAACVGASTDFRDWAVRALTSQLAIDPNNSAAFNRLWQLFSVGKTDDDELPF